MKIVKEYPCAQSVPVSVVIPCFNCELTIERAVRSVFSQTKIPKEVIFVDDYSTDHTLKILKKLEVNFPNIVIVIMSEKNYGAASARNTGWNFASQPFIAFLDADDTWHPKKLSIQYNFMQNNQDVVLCGHQCTLFRENCTALDSAKKNHITKISSKSLLFKNAFSTPTVMLRRDVEFRFQEGRRYSEDVFLWQRVAFANLKVVRIEMPLAYVHKSFYGVDGLSAQLWKMEMGELSNFFSLFRTENISLPLYAVVISFSVVKFFKRILVAAIKRL
jgi:glycosyltransferase involved in cell wall biosynthesis